MHDCDINTMYVRAFENEAQRIVHAENIHLEFRLARQRVRAFAVGQHWTVNSIRTAASAVVQDIIPAIL